MTHSATGLAAILTTPVLVGEAVDLTSRVITDEIMLTDRRIASADLTGACFKAPVSFRRAVFTGLSWFKDCRFEQGADFSGAVFGNDARFDRSLFMGDANFRQVEALGAADFSNAVFQLRTDFEDAVFYGCLSLSGTAFVQGASTRRAQCLGGLWIDELAGDPSLDARGLDVHGRLWLGKLSSETRQRLSAQINCYGYRWSAAE